MKFIVIEDIELFSESLTNSESDSSSPLIAFSTKTSNLSLNTPTIFDIFSFQFGFL